MALTCFYLHILIYMFYIKKALNGKSRIVKCSREGMSPAESIPGRNGLKVHPGADPVNCCCLKQNIAGYDSRPLRVMSAEIEF